MRASATVARGLGRRAGGGSGAGGLVGMAVGSTLRAGGEGLGARIAAAFGLKVTKVSLGHQKAVLSTI